REAKRIGRLVDGLLELARLEAGQSKLRMQPHAFDAVIQAVVEAQSTTALVHDVKVELSAPDDLPTALIDPEYMYRALRILIGHGISRTPASGTLTVTVSECEGHLLVDIRSAAARDWLNPFERIRLDDSPAMDQDRNLDELELS